MHLILLFMYYDIKYFTCNLLGKFEVVTYLHENSALGYALELSCLFTKLFQPPAVTSSEIFYDSIMFFQILPCLTKSKKGYCCDSNPPLFT